MIKRKKNIPLPPVDIVLSIVNDERDTAQKLLLFYDSYILGVASETAYAFNGAKIGVYIDEDLAQDLRLALIRCIPRLRINILQKYFIETVNGSMQG